MKRFNVSKNPMELRGVFPPIGSVYGKFELPIYFNVKDFSDGKVYFRQCRDVEEIVYYLTDFRPVILSNGDKHYYIHVYRNGHWNHNVCTAQDKKYYTLADFLTETIEKAKSKGNLAQKPRVKIANVGKPIKPYRVPKRRTGKPDMSSRTVTDYSCSNKYPFDERRFYI